MPIKEAPFKSALTGEVSSFLDSKKASKPGSDDGFVDFLSVLDFIERFKLLPFGLYPVQRFIVKMYYNIPLNDVDKTIVIKDKLGEKILYTFTEVEYLKYLYDQGRCNVERQDGKERRELILVLGRRSGKSALSAIFAAYELYKLLRRGHPQSYYGMPPGSEIRVLAVANDKEQASIVYGDMQAHVEAVDYFKNALANTTQTFMKFRTENDKKRFGDVGKATVNATFKSSVAKGLRGRGVICAILDEIAFFIDDGKSSAERVYKAIMPSLAQFSPKDPKNKHEAVGPTEGRMILISSPDAKEGFFYRQYQLGMSKDKGSEDMLVIQAPTWEVNPTLDRSYYEKEYFKDPRTFMTEHGAEFSDRVRGWIEDSRDLFECITPKRIPNDRGLPREPHFAGIDVGLVNDGTSIALSRINQGKIELVYHETWYAKKTWKESNPHLKEPLTQYARTLQDVARLDMNEIALWFKAVCSRFYVVKGIFDQWSGIVFEQELHKQGLTQFETRNFFASDSSLMYQTFKMFMYNRQLDLYDYPVPEAMEGMTSGRHSPLITELLELQAYSQGKNIITVEAPNAPGKHDDMSDALARSILVASEYIVANPGILDRKNTITSIPSSQPRMPSYGQYHRMRSRLHGSATLRIPPRNPNR
jgi:hypothetical protein